jgi:site-specific DNA-methyltransferase (adenine-specific)
MDPYYSDDSVTIFHGDCCEIGQSLAVGADLLVTDPPYGNNLEYGPDVDDTPENLERLIREAIIPPLESLGRGAVTPGVANIHRYPPPKWILCWYESAGAGSGPWGFCTWQPVLVYGHDPFLQDGLGRRPDGRVFSSHLNHSPVSGHPCAKPEDVMRWIVERVSRPGEVILDPFMGSGTTLRAAKDLGRKAIGIEVDERYCEIAVKRMAQEVLAL